MLFTDQLNNTIELKEFPKRIISIVPSQTELLWDLGLRDELVGITKFCIHPDEMFRAKERVGGTKQLNFDKIRSLKPDLIIGNKEENEYSQIIELQKEFNVWMSDIYNLQDSLKTIMQIGEITNRTQKATELSQAIALEFELLNKYNKRVLYLIWNNPMMAIGNVTFIGDMLRLNGLQNVLTDANARYPEISVEQIKDLKPDFILLSSEPYPFKEQHIQYFNEQFPFAKTVLVDGEMFSWYGSRLLKSPAYFKSLSNILS